MAPSLGGGAGGLACGVEWGAANDSRPLGRGGLRGPEFPCMKHMCGDESVCNWVGAHFVRED